jgi:hypothetical protein
MINTLPVRLSPDKLLPSRSVRVLGSRLMNSDILLQVNQSTEIIQIWNSDVGISYNRDALGKVRPNCYHYFGRWYLVLSRHFEFYLDPHLTLHQVP